MEKLNHRRFGEVVVTRGVLGGRLWWACPSFVVQDLSELVALYWRVGTPIRAPIKRPTVEDEQNGTILLEERTWVYHDVLSLSPRGAAYTIDIMWIAGTRQMRCWYINLQKPLRRTSIGFDTMDQILDIVISPDCSSWQWKDEDEFSAAQAIGLYSAEKASAIRWEGEKVIQLLQDKSSIFYAGWESWCPPADWTTPLFPPGWESEPIC